MSNKNRNIIRPKESYMNKGINFLLTNISKLQSERKESNQKKKNKKQMHLLKNKNFYLISCEESNYYTLSLFNTKYTYIIEKLLEHYDEISFYLHKKNYFINLLEKNKSNHKPTLANYEESKDKLFLSHNNNEKNNFINELNIHQDENVSIEKK